MTMMLLNYDDDAHLSNNDCTPSDDNGKGGTHNYTIEQPKTGLSLEDFHPSFCVGDDIHRMKRVLLGRRRCPRHRHRRTHRPERDGQRPAQQPHGALHRRRRQQRLRAHLPLVPAPIPPTTLLPTPTPTGSRGLLPTLPPIEAAFAATAACC